MVLKRQLASASADVKGMEYLAQEGLIYHQYV
jgi:hypothetical protein